MRKSMLSRIRAAGQEVAYYFAIQFFTWLINFPHLVNSISQKKATARYINSVASSQ